MTNWSRAGKRAWATRRENERHAKMVAAGHKAAETKGHAAMVRAGKKAALTRKRNAARLVA